MDKITTSWSKEFQWGRKLGSKRLRKPLLLKPYY